MGPWSLPLGLQDHVHCPVVSCCMFAIGPVGHGVVVAALTGGFAWQWRFAFEIVAVMWSFYFFNTSDAMLIFIRKKAMDN